MLLHSTPSLPFSFNLSTKATQFYPASEQSFSQTTSDEHTSSTFSNFTSKLLLPASAQKSDFSTNTFQPQISQPESNPLQNEPNHEVSPKSLILPDSESCSLIGSEVWCGEAKYMGGFKENMKHGYGVLQFRDGLHYKGQFINDNISGYGVANWPDKTYEGYWMNNQKHGKGKENYTDGRKYVGEFKNDKKEGCGEFTWPNGSVFKGMFVNGKQHGEGEFVNQNGLSKRGIWEHGKRVTWIEEKQALPNLGKFCSKEENSVCSFSALNETRKAEHRDRENNTSNLQ